MTAIGPRTVAEWIGATPDTSIPDRVKDRILQRQDDRCVDCKRPFGYKLKAEFDHDPALINGGENRESKIFARCEPCHDLKFPADVAEKSKTYHRRIDRMLPKQPKHRWSR